jgi:hypothetical protein
VDAARNEIAAEGGNKSRRNPLLHGETNALNRRAEQNPGIDYSPRCTAAAL